MIALGLLAACNDSNEDTEENDIQNNETETASEANNEESNEESNEEEEESNNTESEDDTDLEITMEDQEGLGIGDTGTFETVLGDFELTLNSAQLVGEELDGIISELDNLILLELTVKNIDDKALIAEEIMQNMEVTEDLEGSGWSNYAIHFESVEAFEGDINPGEEMTAEFITYAYDAETYYLRQASGTVAAGYNNQVIWEIPAEEAKER